MTDLQTKGSKSQYVNTAGEGRRQEEQNTDLPKRGEAPNPDRQYFGMQLRLPSAQ